MSVATRDLPAAKTSRTPTPNSPTLEPEVPYPAKPSGPAVVFYRLVCRLAKKPDPETGQPRGYAFAFCKWYAAQCGRTVRTIYEWIRQLKNAGWIETQLDEGVRVFIRPLLPVAPPRATDTPRPRSKWSVASEPWSVGGEPQSDKSAPRHKALATNHSSLATDSGVTAGVVAGGYPRTTSETEEKKQREPEKQVAPTAADPVVALMHRCGIVPGSEARYLAEIPSASLEDACRYILRRIEKGLNGGAGYAILVARNLATGNWQFPGWYLREIGAAERKQERESAASQRVISAARPATPKLPIPIDWLPGVPEAEARTLVQDAFVAIRNGTGCAPSPYAEVVREQARLFWQKRNPGKSVPW